MKKSTGWLRICLVFGIIWILGVTIYMWLDVVAEAKNIADIDLSSCMNQKNYDLKNCGNIYSQKFNEIKDANLKDWWWSLPLSIFAPPLIVFLLWLLCFGGVKIFYWILVGFGKKKPKGIKKKSFIMTVGIILVIVSMRGIFAMHEASKQKKFETIRSQCEFQATKSGFALYSNEDLRYIELCIEAKGYHPKGLFTDCTSDMSALWYKCYD